MLYSYLHNLCDVIMPSPVLLGLYSMVHAFQHLALDVIPIVNSYKQIIKSLVGNN